MGEHTDVVTEHPLLPTFRFGDLKPSDVFRFIDEQEHLMMKVGRGHIPAAGARQQYIVLESSTMSVGEVYEQSEAMRECYAQHATITVRPRLIRGTDVVV